jgi:L-asparaginase
MGEVRIVTCGGTIASEPGEDGAAPAKGGDELVEEVPELDGIAEITVEEVASRPGFDMDFETVAAAAEAARRAQLEGVDGVVVTHGTDTLADTAYALWLGLDPDAPVLVTGSQRRFDEPGSDAPSNLLTAVRAAVDDRFVGVHVAFDDELHAARDAVKTHTSALDTFQSPGKGPVATFSRGGVRVHRRPVPPAVTLSTLSDPADVSVVHSGIGVGADALDRAVEADVDGVVLEGTGLGNVTGDLGDAVGRAVESVPVVVASRCHAGSTEPVYGTSGGGVTLDRYGVLWAGDLPASKARVKLALALSDDRDRARLGDLFEAPRRE